MRLIVMGQQAFGKAALDKIIEAGRDEVVAVYCAPDKEGRPVDPVKEAALVHGLPVEQPKSFKDEAALETMRGYGADLCVMAYVIVFVPEAAREIPTHGSICFHPSLLPKHRGPSSINWPIIGGATKSGLTFFWPNDGLDEGEILLQKEVEIGPDDTLGTVYFQKIFPLGVEAVLEAIDLVRAGDPPRLVQDETQASYESWCKKADAAIDWAQPVDRVYNLIRGTNPQPGAWTLRAGQEVQIFDAAKVMGAAGAPGEVIEVTDQGFAVAADGGSIIVTRVRPAGGQKVSAADYAKDTGLVAGQRLG